MTEVEAGRLGVNGESDDSQHSHVVDDGETLPGEVITFGTPGKDNSTAADGTSTQMHDELLQSARDQRLTDAFYLKRVRWNEETVQVLTQNENGPCPLLALCNILLLRGDIKLNPDAELVTAEYLLSLVGDLLIGKLSQAEEAELRVNLEQNVGDAIANMPKLKTGLDINIKFAGFDQMERTQELLVFDILRVPIYHGWVVDPSDGAIAEAVGALSYNQVVEKIVAYKEASLGHEVSENQEDVVQQGMIPGELLSSFLSASASQLTYHGLVELNGHLPDQDLAVLFRNNHFMVLTKSNGCLFTLSTDQGYLHQPVCWESLVDVEGSGDLVDAFFKPYVASYITKDEGPPAGGKAEPKFRDEEINDPDFLLALSLQEEENTRHNSAARHSDAAASQEDQDMLYAMELQHLEDERRTREEQARRRALQEERRRKESELEAARQAKAEKSDSCAIS